MRGLIVIFSLFLSMNAFAQGIDVVHVDSSGQVYTTKRDISVINYKPLILLNGEIYKKELNINADSILDVKLYIGPNAIALFGKEGSDGVINVITKQYAIKEYQKKFSAFSKEYKEYVASNMQYNHDDGILDYDILNIKGSVLFGTGFTNSNDLILELYNIKTIDINKVELHKKVTCCGTNVSFYITTNKN